MCLGLVTDRRLFLWQMSRVRGADQRMSAKHRDKQNIARMLSSVTINCQETKIVINPDQRMSAKHRDKQKSNRLL